MNDRIVVLNAAFLIFMVGTEVKTKKLLPYLLKQVSRGQSTVAISNA